MYLAPLAIFVLVGQSIATSYLQGVLGANIILLSKFVLIFLLALGIQFLWQLLLMLFTTNILKKYSIKELLQVIFPMATSAFITSSSLATLPIAMKIAKKLEAKNEVVDFMLPVCASMNFASGMMYEMLSCLFFMQLLGIDMSLNQQILLGLMCIITGISVGGIPETGMISIITIFTIAHIPLSAIVILMPLDRILDRIRTVVNIIGNTSGCLTVSKLLK
jgi:proton glutamate symport protein